MRLPRWDYVRDATERTAIPGTAGPVKEARGMSVHVQESIEESLGEVGDIMRRMLRERYTRILVPRKSLRRPVRLLTFFAPVWQHSERPLLLSSLLRWRASIALP